MNRDLLYANNLRAERNRGFCEGKNIFSLNLVSSPGSGKTSLLVKTINALKDTLNFFVIAGDQQTANDASRINETGAEVVQVNTGSGCHLDAEMVHNAIDRLKPANGSVLLIENVGNLVCPALFDLGETKRVVMVSVTEGEDKPLKYPHMFASSQLCLINKIDLLPYLDFNLEELKENIQKINPQLEMIGLSVKNGEGMEEWYSWLKRFAPLSSCSLRASGSID